MGKDKEVENAISIIEEAGGIVILPDNEFDDIAARESSQIDSEIKDDQYSKEYEERKAEAFKEFDNSIGKKNFSFSDVEDICFENGIDLDDIEEYINSYY